MCHLASEFYLRGSRNDWLLAHWLAQLPVTVVAKTIDCSFTREDESVAAPTDYLLDVKIDVSDLPWDQDVLV